ncbi:hypothetical protein LSUE1_G007092, partial [Lachnellula suecica]
PLPPRILPHHNPPPPNTPAPADAADKSKDPVIQMLAERASTDPDLKALMRIVANGQAKAEELKSFQSHIDDLTRLQKARQAALQTSQPANKPPPPSPATPPDPRPSPSSTIGTQPYSNSCSGSQARPSTYATSIPKPTPSFAFKGPVFEFTGGTGDRYLFPKFSILEYLPQGQVIASFLIVRKGSASDSSAYDPALDYYQPITIRLYAHQGRQLDALQKVVAPPDEVRRYMDDIMDNMTRAEYVLLAMRLPKDIEPPSEKESLAEKADQGDVPVLWGSTTVSTPVATLVRPMKRLLTEEEKYQSFITSVAATEA